MFWSLWKIYLPWVHYINSMEIYDFGFINCCDVLFFHKEWTEMVTYMMELSRDLLVWLKKVQVLFIVWTIAVLHYYF